MSDHTNNNIHDGSKSRFGSFRFWHKPNNPQDKHDTWADSAILTQNNPRREHVCRPVIIGPDGRARPLVPDFSKCNDNRGQMQTKTVTKEHTGSKDYMMMNEPKKKKGFSASMFQRMRSEYRQPEPGLTTEGGWERPSPAGWKLDPKETLRGSNNAGKTIDSREAAKRYGGRFSF